MREECKNYQSRTYDSGEVMRTCSLDLAPEAPWRCPENCPAYAPRSADVGWVRGSLVEPPLEEEPNIDEDSLEMLEEAEEVVNDIGPSVISEVEKERSKNSSPKRFKLPWKKNS